MTHHDPHFAHLQFMVSVREARQITRFFFPFIQALAGIKNRLPYLYEGWAAMVRGHHASSERREQPGVLELIDVGQVAQRVEPELRQEGRRGHKGVGGRRAVGCADQMR